MRLNPWRSRLATLENRLAIQSLSLIERLLQRASPVLVAEDTEMKEIVLCWRRVVTKLSVEVQAGFLGEVTDGLDLKIHFSRADAVPERHEDSQA